jgi:hypothetical protein
LRSEPHPKQEIIMNVYEIRSEATIAGEGWPRGIRTVYSARRSPEAVARHETTAEERAVRVVVTAKVGRIRGLFFAGVPNQYWRRS